MVDSRLAFDIMARDDGATAVLNKVALSADRTGNALKKTSKISDDVAKATTRLTKAHNAETTALDKVQIAEARLAEVRGNSNAKTTQVLTAEKALSRARRDSAVAGNVAQKAAKDLAEALDNEGKRAGKGFGASLKKWLTGSGGMGDAGKAGGTVFGSGFLGVIKTPILGPAVVAAITAGVVTVMPAVGAIAASGLVTAFGAGLAGLGIVFAAKSDAVKAKWKSTLSSMATDMRVISKPFEKTLVDMAAVAQRTFGKFTIPLQDSFKQLGPAVSEFGDDLGKAFEGFVPVIAPLSSAFAAVLKSLGPAMQSAISNVADGLTRLSDSVKANPDGLADMVSGIGDVTNKLLGFIALLNDTNAQIKKLTGLSGVDLTFKGLNLTAIGSLNGAFKLLNLTLSGVNKLTAPVGQGFHETATSAQEAATAAGYWTQGLNKAQLAAMGIDGSNTKLANGLSATAAHAQHLQHEAAVLAATFDRQWAATQKANDALTRMSGLLLTLSGSEIAYQQAVDDATASIKENGKTHDINTQKGRNNKTALDQVAAAAQAQTVAMRNAGDGNVAAAKAATGARANFVKLATQMEYTVPQAKAMAKSMIAIPNVTREAKLKANITDLTAKLKTATGKLADKNLTKERRAKLNADIAKLEAGIRRAKGLLNGVPGSKTVRITTTFTEIHRVINQGSRSSGGGVGGGHEITGKGSAGGGLIPGRPSSIDNIVKPMATGEYVVQASRVPGNLGLLEAINSGKFQSGGAPAAPARSSRAAQPASGNAITINVNGARDPHAVVDDLVRELRKYVRVAGQGNVQQALGAR